MSAPTNVTFCHSDESRPERHALFSCYQYLALHAAKFFLMTSLFEGTLQRNLQIELYCTSALQVILLQQLHAELVTTLLWWWENSSFDFLFLGLSTVATAHSSSFPSFMPGWYTVVFRIFFGSVRDRFASRPRFLEVSPGRRKLWGMIPARISSFTCWNSDFHISSVSREKSLLPTTACLWISIYYKLRGSTTSRSRFSDSCRRIKRSS